MTTSRRRSPKKRSQHRWPRRAMFIAPLVPLSGAGWLVLNALGSGGSGDVEATASRPKLSTPVYESAAATCPGLPWPVLGAIHAVESRRGNTAAISSAGAQGPMQFLPSTWAAFGVDGDGDGNADIDNPVDAVYGGAQYLCATGGGDPAGLGAAIWNYNHSFEYVDLVLRVSDELRTAGLPAATRVLDGGAP